MNFNNISTTMKIVALIVIAAFVVGLYYWYTSGEPVKQTPTQFGPQMQPPAAPQTENTAAPNTLYGFFHPQCGHCKNFMPVWNQLKQQYESSPAVNIKTIDATKPESERIIFYYGVSAFPTVIMATPEQNIEYDGNRSLDDLRMFVEKNVK